MATTLQQLRNTFYEILREDEDVSAYPLSLADLLINSAQQKICFRQITNPFTGNEVQGGKLDFVNTDLFYSNVQSTTLSDPVAIGATTLTVANTDNYPTSGPLYIAGSIVTYTGKTSTTFTGCSGVLFAFESGTQVSIAFALPANYSSILNVTYNNQFKLPGKLFDDMFEDLNSYKGTDIWNSNVNITPYSSPMRVKPFYTIKDSAYLIVFNREDTEGMIRVRYEKIPTMMTASSDTSIITNDIYAQTTIPYIAVGEMLYNRGEEDRAAKILNFGLSQVADMYNHYNMASFEEQSGVQYRTGKGKMNI